MGFYIGELLRDFRTRIGGGASNVPVMPDVDVEEPYADEDTAERWAAPPTLTDEERTDANSQISCLGEDQFGALKALAHGYSVLEMKRDGLVDSGKIGDLDQAEQIMDHGTNTAYETRPHDFGLIKDIDKSVLFRLIELDSRGLERIRPSASSEANGVDLS